MPASAPAEAPPPCPAALVWIPHVCVGEGRLHTCLRCGCSATVRQPERLLGTPCPGWAANAGRLALQLAAGVFDSDLWRAGDAARALARRRGWRPVAPDAVPAAGVPPGA